MARNFHEQFERPADKLPSDRSTGLVFAAVTGAIAWFWRDSFAISLASGCASVTFVFLCLLAPSLLRPLNVAWMGLALVLGRIVNPIVMLVLYAVVIVPAGLILQLRADPLRRQRQPQADSYWIERDSAEARSMRNQF